MVRYEVYLYRFEKLIEVIGCLIKSIIKVCIRVYKINSINIV